MKLMCFKDRTDERLLAPCRSPLFLVKIQKLARSKNKCDCNKFKKDLTQRH